MDHRVRVDLTHVPASVTLLGTVEVEIPLVLPRPGERDPGVPGDDVVVDGQDGLSVHPHPGNLSTSYIVGVRLQPIVVISIVDQMKALPCPALVIIGYKNYRVPVGRWPQSPHGIRG